MSKNDLIAILKLFKHQNQIIDEIGIFGSAARDDISEDSDIDIVIKTDNADLFLFVHMKEELENLLNKNIDIVRYRERMNPYLKKHIDEEAIYV